MKAPSIEAARKMGETGGPPVEEERLAFEARMFRVGLPLGAAWNGSCYVGVFDSHDEAQRTRQLWAAWRDRASLANERIEKLETALRLAADEPNIDMARAIADAALKNETDE